MQLFWKCSMAFLILQGQLYHQQIGVIACEVASYNIVNVTLPKM